MRIRSYIDAEMFLRDTQVELESNEAANSLMLGICGQLIHHLQQAKVRNSGKSIPSRTTIQASSSMR